MDKEQISQIYNFLTAYDRENVELAIEMFNESIAKSKEVAESVQREMLMQSRWIESDVGDIPPDHEWTRINNKIYIRSFSDRDYVFQKIDEYNADRKEEDKSSPQISKADLSMQQTDKLCMYCGGTLAWEPICGGCRLGKLGFRGRFVCMDDMDHEFYVLREGVILPNQGD